MTFHQEIHDPIDAAAHQLREAQKKQVGELNSHRHWWKKPVVLRGKPKANHMSIISWWYYGGIHPYRSDIMEFLWFFRKKTFRSNGLEILLFPYDDNMVESTSYALHQLQQLHMKPPRNGGNMINSGSGVGHKMPIIYIYTHTYIYIYIRILFAIQLDPCRP